MDFPIFKKDDILKALEPGMKEYEGFVIDCYAAFSDKSFYDGGGWVPEADYDPTTRGWYEKGIQSDSIVLGTPSVDMTTGKMVVCGSRSLNLQDGRKGALSVDVVLTSVSESVSAYTPAKTGKSMLLSGTTIIAAPDHDYVGTDVSEHGDDAFLQAVSGAASNNKDGFIQTLSGNDHKSYFVSGVNVPGTDWVLISYVKENDILSELNTLSFITIALVIAMLVISTLIIMFLIRRMITTPVTGLTDTISKIADGDFTVEIKRGGNNEIGTMNDRMHDYVARMRTTLSEMKDVTLHLADEATASKSAAATMSEQADRQSMSMDQIHTTMEDVANSVTELASNATDLAQAVSETVDQGSATKEIMNELLSKAKQGQNDMTKMQNNMTTISSSMTEMNSVVQSVDEAAQKINSIVEMINSISSQTNLLSLNASIEAARAGEAGRGFAVVATEIGSLATDSANATTEISEIIGDISSQIRKLAEQSASSVKDIQISSEAVTSTGHTFAEIFEALDRAEMTVDQMVEKMNKVNGIAMSVAAIAEEQSASTEEVSATVETAASSAHEVADESRNVDVSAGVVSQSSEKIEEFADSFKI